MDKVAGVVLAGGRSSRMGINKALLSYKGQTLVSHMANILHRADIQDVFISGDVPGYDCIGDAVRHDGPAQAMYSLLEHFSADYERLLFIPVDMPLMQVKTLKRLIAQGGCVYYESYPLPACLVTGYGSSNSRSVRALLDSMGARSIVLPAAYELSMSNINTPEDWESIAS